MHYSNGFCIGIDNYIVIKEVLIHQSVCRSAGNFFTNLEPKKLVDDAHYHGYKPELTEASLTAAWETCFVAL
ncbi:MAG: hypothetical protein R8K50_05420 [Mariprofundus sp.]